MSEREFRLGIDDLLKQYKKRIEKLRAIQSGDAKLRPVQVRSYKVTGYTVRAHTRYI